MLPSVVVFCIYVVRGRKGERKKEKKKSLDDFFFWSLSPLQEKEVFCINLNKSAVKVLLLSRPITLFFSGRKFGEPGKKRGGNLEEEEEEEEEEEDEVLLLMLVTKKVMSSLFFPLSSCPIPRCQILRAFYDDEKEEAPPQPNP